MSKLTHPLKRALRSVLQLHDFRFAKGNWIRENKDLIQMVCLAKRPYGFESYSLRVGICIRELGAPATLLERFGHYLFGMSHNVDPEFDELLKIHLNSDVINETDREARFQRLLETKAIPLLDRLMTIDGLRECYLTGIIQNIGVVRQASMFLFGSETQPKVQAANQTGRIAEE